MLLTTRWSERYLILFSREYLRLERTIMYCWFPWVLEDSWAMSTLPVIMASIWTLLPLHITTRLPQSIWLNPWNKIVILTKHSCFISVPAWRTRPKRWQALLFVFFSWYYSRYELKMVPERLTTSWSCDMRRLTLFISAIDNQMTIIHSAECWRIITDYNTCMINGSARDFDYGTVY